MIMAEKANQHFVPRLLLKRFSNSAGKVNIFDTSSGEIINDVPYRPQCAKRYFYGSDLIIENHLGNLESVVDRIISHIINGNIALNINSEAHIKLVVFSAYQYIRTPEAISWANNVIRKYIKTLILKDKDVLIDLMKEKIENDFEQVIDDSVYEDFLSSLDVSLQSPHKLLFDSANEFVFELINFDFLLLRNETEQKFFISDHPLVLIGPNKNNKRTLLLPFSQEFILIFFEEGAYDNYVENSGVISITELDDVDSLNKLQYLNSNKNIYFSDEVSDEYIKKVHKDNECEKLKDKFSYVAEDGKLFIRRNNIDFELDLNCLKNTSVNYKEESQSVVLSLEQISFLAENGYLLEPDNDEL
ncbi:DUF4238 domain-containing protein [Pectobacterium carotovorum subsp. carotovorum]|nr:DUF4238 domain-containing protein [Pectobacterium carotovorum subsp. carotovorum]